MGIVLAAGVGERFGSATKQLAEFDGRPLVAHAVDVLLAAEVSTVLVVVGHDRDAVAAAVSGMAGVDVVDNPHFRSGQASSLAAGLRAARGTTADVAVVLLADQPGIASDAVRRVLGAVAAGAEVARARYTDGAGHPIAFARRTWDRVAGEVAGDAGARQLLDGLDVQLVDVEGTVPRDVDAPEDLPAAD